MKGPLWVAFQLIHSQTHVVFGECVMARPLFVQRGRFAVTGLVAATAIASFILSLLRANAVMSAPL